METRQIHVRDLSTVTGIQQYEHDIQSIYFLGLEDFEGTIYISIESEEYSDEEILLNDYTFVIGQPMTEFNTTYTCQIYGMLNDGEKIKLSKRFRLIVDKSNNITGKASPVEGDTFSYIADFDEEFDMSVITNAVLAVKHNGAVTEYSDLTIDAANHQITRTFTQTESIGLGGTSVMELVIVYGGKRKSVSIIKADISASLVKEVIV